MVSRRPRTRARTKLGLWVIAFALFAGLILTKPVRNLQDFDEPYYAILAYDLDRYHVFTNGPFSQVDDTTTRPPPGMFFGPVYPTLVAAAMQIDPRFAAAVRCSVEADQDHRDIASCDPYDRPMRLLNAVLLAIAVVAIASAAELIFERRMMFALAALGALIAIGCESTMFSYVMTESTIFAIYSVLMLITAVAWRSGRVAHFVLAGLALGLLSLTKPSYLIVWPLIAVLTWLYGAWILQAARSRMIVQVLAFSLAFGGVVGAWAIRNAVSVGKFGLTEEYGATSLIERFAYDDMTVREYFQAFPYCTPGLGAALFDIIYGTDSMHRFTYHTEGSFFHNGRGRREALVAQYGRLDPLILGIVRDELRANWWRYLLVSIPLAWCGIWAGWLASLVLVPLFVWACIRCVRTRQPLLLLYAAPAVIMVGVDAMVGNHYTRYNLVLIGPYAIGAAFMILSWWSNGRWRSPLPGSESLSAPSGRAVSDANST